MTNTWQQDLDWYDKHQYASQIGFNPDGMCLKVCRTSRGVGSKYMTAKECQDNVPKALRFTRVRDWRKGMKLFVDDPNDSNTAGHIVTIVGRVKGFDWDDPNDVIVETNSVVSGQLVRVRATYFTEHWGDKIQFAAPWINGVELDYPGWKHDDVGEESPSPRLEHFRQSRPNWDVAIVDRAVEAGRRDLTPAINTIEAAVESLPEDNSQGSLVKKFKDRFEKDRVLEMALINKAVENGRSGKVKDGRDRIRAGIKAILRHV